MIPWVVMDSPNWTRLSGTAQKLLLSLYRQYKGSNNGDLCAALRILKPMGFTRGETISNGIRELIHYGMIEMTRQGNLHRSGLYAVTWRPIDYCKGRLLEVSATNVASGLSKEPRELYERPIKKSQAE